MASRTASACEARSENLMESYMNGVPSFISKLAMMLGDRSATQHVCWSRDGESIHVQNPTMFATHVLPKYFRHSNFASFVRQLNLYGFNKSSNRRDSCEFTHHIFRQGNEHHFKDIRRKVGAGSVMCERDGMSTPEFEKLHADFEELRSKYDELESVLDQKEAEQRVLFSELMKSKEKQRLLEQNMSKVVGVLMRACGSVMSEPQQESRVKTRAMTNDEGEAHKKCKRARLKIDTTSMDKKWYASGEQASCETSLSCPNDISQSDDWKITCDTDDLFDSLFQATTTGIGDIVTPFRTCENTRENQVIPVQTSSGDSSIGTTVCSQIESVEINEDYARMEKDYVKSAESIGISQDMTLACGKLSAVVQEVLEAGIAHEAPTWSPVHEELNAVGNEVESKHLASTASLAAAGDLRKADGETSIKALDKSQDLEVDSSNLFWSP